MPEWITNVGIILGIIGSIFSIIGLPITIWQVLIVKSKQKASEDAIRNYEEQRVAETLGKILENLNQVSEQIIVLRTASTKPGYDLNGRKARQSITNIIQMLNGCLNQLPANQKEIARIIKDTIEIANKNPIDSEIINSVYDKVVCSIALLKIEKEKYINASIETNAKASQ